METAQRAVLFVDVTDSTKIYESLGDTVALALINGLFSHLDKTVAKYSGSVIKTLGDGLLCMFEDPNDGFRAACEMQSSVTSLAQRAHNRLQIKIGFTYGPVILSKGDVFGDTMNVCARLVTLANPEQILTSGQTVDALSPGLRVRCRQLYPLKVKGKAEQVMVHDVLWRLDPDITERDLPARPTTAKGAVAVLKISYGGESFTVGPAQEVLIGRDKGNDIIIESTRASRVHARIFGRDGNFVIADQSSNGTFLLIDGNSREMLLRREEAVMGERGWVGVGKSAEGHGTHVLRYRLERRGA